MVHVSIPCPVEGCNFESGAYPASIVAERLSIHKNDKHPAAAAAAPAERRRGPKVDRPEISDTMEEESWNALEQSWRMFVQLERIPDGDMAVQLYSCCKTSLKAKITAVHPDFLDRPVNELLPMIKMLTVIPIAKTVKQNELLQMKQAS